MFRREWLQSSRISVLELAYISVGKEPDLAQSMEKPELWRHQILKDAIADGALTSCGERYPYPPMPDVPHGGSLLRFDDLADYAKTVSFGWLNNVLKLWEAVGAEAPQDEMEEIFTSLRLDVEGLASDPVKITPQHQYRTRLLNILEEIWSEIDTSDWEATPPKKISIETDVINRFGLSQREAGMIAGMFIPDDRRGKSQKG